LQQWLRQWLQHRHPALAAETSVEDKALSLIKENRFDLAIPILSEEIKRCKRPLLFRHRGWCYTETGKLDQAIADFNQAEKLDPKDSRIYSMRGYCYIKEKQWRKAIAELDKAITLGDKSAYINRALAYDQLGDHSKAIQDGQKIQEAKMESALKEADNLDQRQNFAAAEKKYAEAIAFNPSSVVGYMARGDMHRRRSQFDEAIADFSKALNISGGNNGKAYFERAETYLRANRWEECIADCNQAIKRGNNDDAYRTRAAAYLGLGQTNSSIADLTAAIANLSRKPLPGPKSPQKDQVQSIGSHDLLALCYSDRANIYAQSKQNELAASDYARAAEADPMAFRPTWEAALFLDKIGKVESATIAYSKLIARFPKMSEPYRRRGDNYLKTGHADKSVTDYTKAIELMDIDAGPSYAARAQAYEKLGKPDLAKKDRDMAKKLK
jgi:tetratricopeptide (TPR) repeat protein